MNEYLIGLALLAVVGLGLMRLRARRRDDAKQDDESAAPPRASATGAADRDVGAARPDPMGDAGVLVTEAPLTRGVAAAADSTMPSVFVAPSPEEIQALADALARDEREAKAREEARQAERRAQDDAQARAEAAADAQAQAYEQAQAEAEAQARAREEEQADARIRAQAEEAERARLEAQAREREREEAEAAAKAQALADAQAREAAEADARLQAEALAREAAAAQAREEAEARAREEAQARLHEEAQARAQAEAAARDLAEQAEREALAVQARAREQAEQEARQLREAAERAEREAAVAKPTVAAFERPLRPAAGPRVPAETLVLVVDDSKLVRVKVSRLLTSHGYRVAQAAGGEEAMTWCAAQPPDVVVTDAEMPEIDGFALSEHLRAQPRTASVPIIMITAADDRHREHAQASGVTLVLGKPYEDEQLLHLVGHLQHEAAIAAEPVPG